MATRRWRCWLACGVALGGVGPWLAVPAGAETVTIIGSLGTDQQLDSDEIVESVVVDTFDEDATVETIEVLTDGYLNKYQSGATASNDAIYACPVSASKVLKVDTTTDAISVFGDSSSIGDDASKWGHAVLASNDKVYCVPDSATTVLEIDTANDEVVPLGDGNIDARGYKYKHAVLANGAIYGIPFNANAVLKVDPGTGTVSQNLGVDVLSNDLAKWHHGVLASSGVIYGIPCKADAVLKINPADDSVTTIGDVSGAGNNGYRWMYGVLAQNGFIYAAPYSATAVLRIDTATDTVTMLDSFTSTGRDQWYFSIASSTGVIYALPDKAKSILRIAPGNDSVESVSELGSFSDSHSKYRDGAEVDGAIYGIPYQAGSVLKIFPENDTILTFVDFGDQLLKWRGASVASNGAIYALPSGAGNVLKVHPQGVDTPPDGWEEAVATTASAGVVGVAAAFIAFAAFCGLALVIRKRLQAMHIKRLTRAETPQRSPRDDQPEPARGAGVQQDRAPPVTRVAEVQVSGNYPASGSFAPGPAAGYSDSPAPIAAPFERSGLAAAAAPEAAGSRMPRIYADASDLQQASMQNTQLPQYGQLPQHGQPAQYGQPPQYGQPVQLPPGAVQMPAIYQAPSRGSFRPASPPDDAFSMGLFRPPSTAGNWDRTSAISYPSSPMTAGDPRAPQQHFRPSLGPSPLEEQQRAGSHQRGGFRNFDQTIQSVHTAGSMQSYGTTVTPGAMRRLPGMAMGSAPPEGADLPPPPPEAQYGARFGRADVHTPLGGGLR